MGTTGNRKKGKNHSKAEKWMEKDGVWLTVNWQKRIVQTGTWGGNLVMDEGKPLYSGQICGSLE